MPARRPKKSDQTAPLFADPAEAAGEPVPPPVGFPESWLPVLGSEFAKPYFAKLAAFVAVERATQKVLPAEDEVFSAFRHVPPDGVRVVVLGQDPYPTPGHPHGLAFSVRPDVRPLPGSLRNIYKELFADLGVPPAPHGCLTPWADQGVLLLNAVLTVRAGAPASHANKGWEKFTDAALSAIGAPGKPAVFVLWGNYAQKKAALIDETRHAIVRSAHPSPLSAKAGFFGSKPFSQVNAALARFGEKPIAWELPNTVKA